jgi:hypothetical protein
MPETYEQSVEETQEETPDDEEHLKGLSNPTDAYDGPNVEIVDEDEIQDRLGGVIPTPGELLPGGDSELGDGIPDLPDTGDPEFDLGDIDLSDLDQLSQLEVLAEVARLLTVQVSLLDDLRSYTRPFNNITVSGTNIIEEDNTPVPVVPQSDETNIPTRLLFIKADPDNTEPIAIGDDEVSPNSGFILDEGRTLTLEVDLRGVALWMSSEEAGQGVQLLGVI